MYLLAMRAPAPDYLGAVSSFLVPVGFSAFFGSWLLAGLRYRLRWIEGSA
jgi:hypothetical protein